MNKVNSLLQFVENVLNENNKKANAIAFDGEQFNDAMNIIIAFQRKHQELYNKLLKYCSENDLIVVRTVPATLETAVRVPVE